MRWFSGPDLDPAQWSPVSLPAHLKLTQLQGQNNNPIFWVEITQKLVGPFLTQEFGQNNYPYNPEKSYSQKK